MLCLAFGSSYTMLFHLGGVFEKEVLAHLLPAQAAFCLRGGGCQLLEEKSVGIRNAKSSENGTLLSIVSG